jgi:hypothetical protein
MVFGFETANRTPSTVSPSPSRTAPAPADPYLYSELAPAPDDGHTDHPHILSHATIPTGTEKPRAQDNMISQDGEVEGRPPFLHVGRTFVVGPVTAGHHADRNREP